MAVSRKNGANRDLRKYRIGRQRANGAKVGQGRRKDRMMGTVSQNGHKRAVLYARVSSDDRGKDNRNLDGQIEMGRKYALDHAYAIVAA